VGLRSTVVIVALAVLVAACGDDGEARDELSSTSVPPTTAGPPVGLPSDSSGEFGVGRTTVMLVDDERGGRALTVDAWYPVDPEVAAVADPSSYTFIPGIEFTTDVARSGVPVSTEGPFPLVVFSHGQGGIRFQSTYLTEVLASQGYIVLAPDHPGDTAVDLLLGVGSGPDLFERGRDVTFLIDAAVDDVDPALADLAPEIDGERIGVAGHSLGGFTALTVAGGGLDSPPDERVDAVVALAGASDLGEETLAGVDVPTLLISGTRDESVPIDTDIEPAWEGIAGGPVVRVDIVDAGHQSFSDACLYPEVLPLDELEPGIVAFVDGLAVAGCGPGLIDHELAQDIVNTYAVGFFDEFVGGDPAAGAYLSEAYAETIPEIEFQRRG
jgi:predicted dienelactone hydrolase